jgi:hypothetical protein
MLPRFPTPALEVLRQLLPVRDVLALLTVDRREAPARHWFIAQYCAIDLSQRYHAERLMLAHSGWCLDYSAGKGPWPEGMTRLVVETGPMGGILINDLRLPHTLTDLAIPADLREFAVGLPNLRRLFLLRHSGVRKYSFPPQLLELRFDESAFDTPIGEIEWPRSLRRLDLGDGFNQSLEGANWPPGLVDLELGVRMEGSLGSLPPGLERLAHWGTRAPKQTFIDVHWPPELEELHVAALEIGCGVLDCLSAPNIVTGPKEWHRQLSVRFPRVRKLALHKWYVQCVRGAMVLERPKPRWPRQR